MAALICIKIVCGTFFVLGNIDNHFLHIFYNLETLIRSIFPGGAGGPHLPTQLLRLLLLIWNEKEKRGHVEFCDYA